MLSLSNETRRVMPDDTFIYAVNNFSTSKLSRRAFFTMGKNAKPMSE